MKLLLIYKIGNLPIGVVFPSGLAFSLFPILFISSSTHYRCRRHSPYGRKLHPLFRWSRRDRFEELAPLPTPPTK
ncbi:hypothetical protein HID58_042905 [Brassica napus]|uniref:Uncharacterized protein n=1 Tax=Brassica napus TaxID=3708 RepID=A0ABQ8BF04_BRANA|nr:hypothetical protein HID58_042905 [Brassica napus]